ncbi:NUDIX domain-containing protein [Flammeovirga sp. MY04]|uniref:NUDIX hydrolase n=1 Tax=Flammeovirga sp. MY04 TaxID=1191459 RepID=UPI0008063DE2|nr:NUDIX domain-containing protein [Flammeovirga sp. MY04]ANQ48236.1 NUDIX domain-containing protein [Flammeovirga sp. MY04]
MHLKESISYCPKCGKKEFIFDKKRFVCNSCHFDLYINASAAVAALILNDKNELLLTRRKFDPHQGTLDLPGGFVDIHEKGEDALKREIKEELNLEITEMNYFGSFPNTYTFRGNDYYTLDLAFICRVESFEPMQANDDVSAIEFIPLDKVNVDEIGLSSIKVILGSYLGEVL